MRLGERREELALTGAAGKREAALDVDGPCS
jgi:hypothetical protein